MERQKTSFFFPLRSPATIFDCIRNACHRHARPQAVMQKAVFHVAKDALSGRKRRPFALQKAVFYNICGKRLIFS